MEHVFENHMLFEETKSERQETKSEAKPETQETKSESKPETEEKRNGVSTKG
jgi:hypothetical protein